MAKKRVIGRYPKAFRKMAVERLKRSDNIVALSQELGVHRRLLYKWRDQLEPIEDGEGPPANSRERELRQQVTQLKRVVADKTLEGVTGLRLDATVVACHSDKEGAEPNFKGFGLLTELLELSSQFREWLLPGTVTVPDHDRTRRSSSGYGEPRRAAGWFPSGDGRSVGSVSAGRSVG